MTIAAIGLPTDGTFVHFLAEAAMREVGVVGIDLRQVVRRGQWRLAVPDRGNSFIGDGVRQVDLSSLHALYVRPITLWGCESDPLLRARWEGLFAGLLAWLELTPAAVVNRPGSHSHNAAKPLHEAWLRNAGFRVPESLTSSEAEELRAFADAAPTICKTCSGRRADAFKVTSADFATYHASQGPVHLQRMVYGTAIRAHIVGNQLIAQRVLSTATDYRAEGRATYRRCELPTGLANDLILGTRCMGLTFSGWDLIEESNGDFSVLEANPMPGYASYDRRCGGAISEALLCFLQGGDC